MKFNKQKINHSTLIVIKLIFINLFTVLFYFIDSFLNYI